MQSRQMVSAIETYERLHQSVFAERYYQHRRASVAEPLGGVALEGYGADRLRDELASGITEALSGAVRDHYKFDIIDGLVCASDGEPLEVSMLRARRDAYELASNDPRYQFVVDRFELELDELHEQQRLPGSEYNTIITASPMTFELAAEHSLLKNGYQRPDVQRSMVRISHWDGKKLHVHTRSLDYGSFHLLRSAMEKATGHIYQAQDSLTMLGERQNRYMALQQVEILLDTICDNFDELLSPDGQTVQGIPRERYVDLTKFVYAYPGVLDSLCDEIHTAAVTATSYAQFEASMMHHTYNYLALYADMLKGKQVVSSDIRSSAGRCGEGARTAGTEFSMCGEIVGAGGTGESHNGMGYDSLSVADRVSIVLDMQRAVGSGSCKRCGANGRLHGCGVYCGKCTREWCDIVLSTGKMPASLKFGRVKNAVSNGNRQKKATKRTDASARHKRDNRKPALAPRESGFFSGWQLLSKNRPN